MTEDDRTRARRRALRAARAVTLGLAMAPAGCSASHRPPGPTRDAATVEDGATGDPDAGLRCDVVPADTPECCAEQGGFWDPMYGCAIAVPGPFVPPAMRA